MKEEKQIKKLIIVRQTILQGYLCCKTIFYHKLGLDVKLINFVI